MKECFKCGLIKKQSEFYKHNKMGDGRLGKCISCTKKDVSDNYKVKIVDPEWKDAERTRGREKYRRLYVGVYRNPTDGNIKWKAKFPEKKRAISMSAHVKPPGIGLEKHHWSYNDEHFKDVIWLTKKHHMKAHRFLVYDQEQKKYRRFDNNELLETKTRHKIFILHCIKNKQD